MQPPPRKNTAVSTLAEPRPLGFLDLTLKHKPKQGVKDAGLGTTALRLGTRLHLESPEPLQPPDVIRCLGDQCHSHRALWALPGESRCTRVTRNRFLEGRTPSLPWFCSQPQPKGTGHGHRSPLQPLHQLGHHGVRDAGAGLLRQVDGPAQLLDGPQVASARLALLLQLRTQDAGPA